MEIETQQGYATLVDQMLTHLTLTLPDAESNDFLGQLRQEVAATHHTLSDKVLYVNIPISHSDYIHCTLEQRKEMSKLDKTLKERFVPRDGPFFSTLERSLQELNVKRQAYQGGTFVGNHVHKLLRVSIMHILNEAYPVTVHHSMSNINSPSPKASKFSVATSVRLPRATPCPASNHTQMR